MGPKKEKKGGKKKTKQEIEDEKKQKEIEERQGIEQEMKRLEEERKESERLARNKKEEQLQYRIDELRALKQETDDAAGEVAERTYGLAALEQLGASKEAWAKYVECNPRPDAASEAALNTYLSLLEEEKPSSMDDALKSCEYTEGIAQELAGVLANAEAKGHADEAKHCSAFLQRLRDASCAKLDAATAHILQVGSPRARVARAKDARDAARPLLLRPLSFALLTPRGSLARSRSTRMSSWTTRRRRCSSRASARACGSASGSTSCSSRSAGR